MSVRKSSGEENLRANPSVKSGSASDPDGSPKQQSIDIPPKLQQFDDDSASGMRSDYAVKAAGPKDTPSGSADHRPAGVQGFDSLSGDPR
jgi:hypothetical protein